MYEALQELVSARVVSPYVRVSLIYIYIYIYITTNLKYFVGFCRDQGGRKAHC